MIAALIPNLTRKNALKTTLNVCQILDELDTDYIISDEFTSSFVDTSARFMPFDAMLEACDIVISVGGDGTIIHAAKAAAEHAKPILGVNAGRLAFMAGLEADELNLLSRLKDSSFTTDRRMLLSVNLFENGELVCSKNCINEVVVSRGAAMRIVEIDVECDGHPIGLFSGDGVVVATPTGSTAYSLSAGGPVIDPVLKSILLTPICPHSLVSRSVVFSELAEIKVYSSSGDSLFFSCDGETPEKISSGSFITICKAGFSAEFIRIKTDTFIGILNSKLNQRRDIPHTL